MAARGGRQRRSVVEAVPEPNCRSDFPATGLSACREAFLNSDGGGGFPVENLIFSPGLVNPGGVGQTSCEFSRCVFPARNPAIQQVFSRREATVAWLNS